MLEKYIIERSTTVNHFYDLLEQDKKSDIPKAIRIAERIGFIANMVGDICKSDTDSIHCWEIYGSSVETSATIYIDLAGFMVDHKMKKQSKKVYQFVVSLYSGTKWNFYAEQARFKLQEIK